MSLTIKPRKQQSQNLKIALKELITNQHISTQQGLCKAMQDLGFHINQSTISRVLRQIGAVKTKDTHNRVTYCLPKETSPPPTQAQLSNLVLRVQKNEAMVIVHTSPGAASLIARILDHNINHIHAIGIISGDDTIFISPDSMESITRTYYETSTLLSALSH